MFGKAAVSPLNDSIEPPQRKRRLGRGKALVLAAMAAVGFIATCGAAQAATAPGRSYPFSTYCTIITTSTIDSPSWQQQLIGVPTQQTETMYAEEPATVTNYVGTARLNWSAIIVYQATNGSWYAVPNSLMSASATLFGQRSGSYLQSIYWNGQYPTQYFARNVPAGRPARAFAELDWLNSAGQVIAKSTHYLPDYNC